ncbi:MAG TPA: MarR family transcriptional regulator [Caldimonas sp.]|jgi:DNA-binding MarR family transcriptional regulator
MSSRDAAVDRSPMLGAMFRLIHSALVQEYGRWLATSSYLDVRPAHAAVMQPLWQVPEGERLTTLARTASITKQAAGALVDALEQAGYVERIPDPDDRRATRIRLTARGRAYGRDVRRFGRELEGRLADRLGERRLKELRATLDLLWESLQSKL